MAVDVNRRENPYEITIGPVINPAWWSPFRKYVWEVQRLYVCGGGFSKGWSGYTRTEDKAHAKALKVAERDRAERDAFEAKEAKEQERLNQTKTYSYSGKRSD